MERHWDKLRHGLPKPLRMLKSCRSFLMEKQPNWYWYFPYVFLQKPGSCCWRLRGSTRVELLQCLHCTAMLPYILGTQHQKHSQALHLPCFSWWTFPFPLLLSPPSLLASFRSFDCRQVTIGGDFFLGCMCSSREGRPCWPQALFQVPDLSYFFPRPESFQSPIFIGKNN